MGAAGAVAAVAAVAAVGAVHFTFQVFIVPNLNISSIVKAVQLIQQLQPELLSNFRKC